MGFNMTEALENEHLKEIIINWSYPMQLSSILCDERVNNTGLYCISRKFGSNETLLYIGKTNDCFYNRLIDHYDNWLSEVRGRIFIRLGSITYPTHKNDYELGRIIEDAERVLIYGMQPLRNIKATVSYTPNHLYLVTNTGFRGELYPSLSMREHII